MKIPFFKLAATIFIIFSLLMSVKGGSQNLATLNNYRIPINKKSAFIGKTYLPEEFTKSSHDIVYKISSDTAKLFRINREGEIYSEMGKFYMREDHSDTPLQLLPMKEAIKRTL